jgi:hypothetical protein
MKKLIVIGLIGLFGMGCAAMHSIVPGDDHSGHGDHGENHQNVELQNN